MLVVLGYIVVVAAVLGGYAMTGGHMGALYQPAELVIIGGAAAGAFIATNTTKALKATLKALPGLFKSSKYKKELYLDVMSLLYVLLSKARREGILFLEKEIADPAASSVFSQYPRILSDPVVMEFLTDYLRMMVNGNMNAFEIEALMDHEIETFRHEAEIPAHALSRVGDALPAFGIVAAVMGVVHALASADLPPAELGALIAHAMVGTFLGILLAYGFVSPLAARIELQVSENVKVYECIKVVLLASLNGYAPLVAVEFGRKVLYSTVRPSFLELDDHVREVKSLS
ncbi:MULTISPECIES: flagellar motor stator protein MotA [Cupriavidus]|uniref:Chemotaxis MotA protein n=3 Tax=Cupriavidus TaxID=106589 RepID=Q46PI3_CUPPJ|nr:MULTISPECIES: flagellar motor stator protein MotA [Cupriavidus]QYY29648.1 flagellar motor stator protein MotA [Cupriavidus pinatubonensis]TPQ36943.1 flagellar motor stator protein MotA [Cupriavidus pinatubonensis]CAG2157496.1 Motility protein A [Cupriavidus numazuensis]CAG9184843.1 Motility protein A [Cupriavidus pinatubonensis]